MILLEVYPEYRTIYLITGIDGISAGIYVHVVLPLVTSIRGLEKGAILAVNVVGNKSLIYN